MPIPTQSSSTPVPTSTTSVTPSPTPTEDAKVAAGRAAVTRYFTEYNKAIKSGDTSTLRDTFSKSCSICLTGASRIDADNAAGHIIDGGAYKVGPVDLLDPNTLAYQATVSQAAVTIRDKDGKALNSYDATGSAKLIFRVAAKSGDYVLAEIVE